jgi:hypothetical protein
MANVIQRANVRVREFGHGFGFALQALLQRRIGGLGSRKDLDRYLALQPGIAGAIYLSHAASAQRRLDLIGTEAGTSAEAHGAWRAL